MRRIVHAVRILFIDFRIRCALDELTQDYFSHGPEFRKNTLQYIAQLTNQKKQLQCKR